ncbi:MAG: hypothetical protein QM688_07550 [Sphingomonas bacterium]
MKKWAARIGVAILVVFAALLAHMGLWALIRAGTAPLFVSTTYDRIAGWVRDDPHSRCYLPNTRLPNGSTLSGFRSDRDCYDWGGERTFSGIYIDELEGERFMEGQAPASSYCPHDEVWMMFDEKSDLRAMPALKLYEDGSRIWSVRFIGRKTAKSGEYGHMGMSTEEVLVDRMVSANLIAAYPGYVPNTVLRCR